MSIEGPSERNTPSPLRALRSDSIESPTKAYDAAVLDRTSDTRQTTKDKARHMSIMTKDSKASPVRRSQRLPNKRKSLHSSISSRRDSAKDDQNQQHLVNLHQLAPYYANKDVHMKDNWTIGPLNKLTFDERKHLN